LSKNIKRAPRENKVISITYEEIGLFPRSFSRVIDRFLKQIFSDVENLVIQEYRFYRYLFLTTIQTIFVLVFVPLFVNFIAKTYLIRPVTEYFWNTKQTEIFLNSYEQKRAFIELQDFEEKLYFESLLASNSSILASGDWIKPRTTPNLFSIGPEATNGSLGLKQSVEAFESLKAEPNIVRDHVTKSLNSLNRSGRSPQETSQKTNSLETFNLTSGSAYIFGQQPESFDKLGKAVDSSNNLRASRASSPSDFLSLQNQADNFVGLQPELSNQAGQPLMRGAQTPFGLTATVQSKTQPASSASAPAQLLSPQGLQINPTVSFLGINKGSSVKDTAGYEGYGSSLVGGADYESIAVQTEAQLPQIMDGQRWALRAYIIQKSNFLQERLQEKTVELAIRYNNHSIEAITNFFADFLSLLTLLYLLVSLEIQINITKSFLLEVFFGLDDSKKSLLILIMTDLLVGYHSSNLWELFFQFLFNHYGIPESQTGIFLLVATLPVLLDVLFKYLIFRHLNRASPATVATYHAIIE
jgi:hypothetical protein